MFAPAHHSATRYVIPVRKELAVRTIFNFLGPLTNPAGATRQVIGVSDPAFLETIAGALARLGAERALVVSSADGLDELSTSAPTRVVEVDGRRPAHLRRHPGGRRAARAATRATSARGTAGRQRRHDAPDPGRRAAARSATSRCSTPAPRSTSAAGRIRLREGVEAAAEAVDSGAAAAALDALTALTARLLARR